MSGCRDMIVFCFDEHAICTSEVLSVSAISSPSRCFVKAYEHQKKRTSPAQMDQATLTNNGIITHLSLQSDMTRSLRPSRCTEKGTY